VSDPVVVEVRFEADGSVSPLAFVWRGRRHRVASLRRRGEVEGQQHFLVMTPEEKVFELTYAPEQGTWQIRERSARGRRPRRSA
jgi:hypothetical protein